MQQCYSSRKSLIVFIAGYSRVGKTTLISSAPYPSVSTSQILTEVTARVLKNFDSGFSSTQLEQIEHLLTVKSSPSTAKKLRQAKIKVAEEILVPIFRREIFIREAVRRLPNAPVILWETIGGEELIKTCQELSFSKYNVHGINIRHSNGLNNVDIRELIGDNLTSDWIKGIDYNDISISHDSASDQTLLADMITSRLNR